MVRAKRCHSTTEISAKNVADIYKLTKADLLSLERLADKPAQTSPTEIENSKQLPLERVIYGLVSAWP
jgi:DNA ligase (NAD+)